MSIDITVTIREGTLVYNGVRPNGAADWRFFRRTPQGPRTAPLPKRFERILRKEKEQND